MLRHGTLLVTNWRLKIEPDLQEPQQAQQGQEQHHLHDQHRRPRGRRPASASRRTSSSTCSAGTPASQWRSQTCPRERQSPGSNIKHQFVHERCKEAKILLSIIVGWLTLVVTHELSSPTLPSNLFQHSTRVVILNSGN